MPIDKSINIEDCQKTASPYASTTYLSTIRENHKKFIEKTIRVINTSLVKTVGKEQAVQVMKLIQERTLDLESPEGWKQVVRPTHDPSIELYKSCKSFEEFIFNFFHYIRNIELSCYANIVFKEFLFVVADMLAGDNPSLTIDVIKPYFNILASNYSVMMENSNYYFQIVDRKLLKTVESVTGFDLTFYPEVVRLLLTCIYQNHSTSPLIKLPQIEMHMAVCENSRLQQCIILSEFFNTDFEEIKELTRNVNDLGVPSPRLLTLLEYLSKKSGRSSKGVLSKLKTFKGSPLLNTYRPLNTLKEALGDYDILFKNSYHKTFNKIYINETIYAESLQPYSLEFLVDCRGKTTAEITYVMDAVKSLSTAHTAYLKKTIKGKKIKRGTYKITLNNVKYYNHDFIIQIKKKTKSMVSMSGGNFILEVRYDPKIISSKTEVPSSDYIRIISDIHADYNRDNMYTLNFSNDFVINCGDTAGNAYLSADWNKTHINHGVVVPGNHLGYSYKYMSEDPEENDRLNTKEGQLQTLEELLKHSPVQFLNNACTTYKGITIIGSCLYSDFNLYGEKYKEECMHYADKAMNDFRLITTCTPKKSFNNGKWELLEDTGEIRKFTPLDHAYLFWQSFNYIKEKVIEAKGKPVIVVTHFAPSNHSIHKDYEGDMLNGAFASNLNQFIIDNPHIRLWCFGHTHKKFNYLLGETRMVCQPFGYNNENNADLPFNYGLRIPIADIKSMKPWKEILPRGKGIHIDKYTD